MVISFSDYHFLLSAFALSVLSLSLSLALSALCSLCSLLSPSPSLTLSLFPLTLFNPYTASRKHTQPDVEPAGRTSSQRETQSASQPATQNQKTTRATHKMGRPATQNQKLYQRDPN
jgi:hypothetical protein